MFIIALFRNASSIHLSTTASERIRLERATSSQDGSRREPTATGGQLDNEAAKGTMSSCNISRLTPFRHANFRRRGDCAGSLVRRSLDDRLGGNFINVYHQCISKLSSDSTNTLCLSPLSFMFSRMARIRGFCAHRLFSPLSSNSRPLPGTKV